MLATQLWPLPPTSRPLFPLGSCRLLPLPHIYTTSVSSERCQLALTGTRYGEQAQEVERPGTQHQSGAGIGIYLSLKQRGETLGTPLPTSDDHQCCDK